MKVVFRFRWDKFMVWYWLPTIYFLNNTGHDINRVWYEYRGLHIVFLRLHFIMKYNFVKHESGTISPEYKYNPLHKLI